MVWHCISHANGTLKSLTLLKFGLITEKNAQNCKWKTGCFQRIDCTHTKLAVVATSGSSEEVWLLITRFCE